MDDLFWVGFWKGRGTKEKRNPKKKQKNKKIIRKKKSQKKWETYFGMGEGEKALQCIGFLCFLFLFLLFLFFVFFVCFWFLWCLCFLCFFCFFWQIADGWPRNETVNEIGKKGRPWWGGWAYIYIPSGRLVRRRLTCIFLCLGGGGGVRGGGFGGGVITSQRARFSGFQCYVIALFSGCKCYVHSTAGVQGCMFQRNCANKSRRLLWWEQSTLAALKKITPPTANQAAWAYIYI